ncbi:MAG TPA: xanthine dehydrogenase family protein molybdopterin-binding subunit [Geminicoccaceae bacterium]
MPAAGERRSDLPRRPTCIGKPLPRFEDRRFLTGAGRYTADLDLPGQAHAVVVRSAHAHAQIAGVEVEAARHAPGVLAVYTSEDLRAAGIGSLPSWTRTPPFKVLNVDGTEMPLAEQYPLAMERVRYVGEPVALVIAKSAAAARDAAELVEVDWRPLPALTEVDAALAERAPLLWPELSSNRSFRWEAGDRDAVAERLSAAAHVIELEVDHPRAIVAFMEPRAAIGSYDPTGRRYTLHAGCQSAHQLRTVLAQVLGEPEEALRVVVPDVGGGFGARNIAYPEFVLVLFAAKALGRPVKWVAERSESFVADAQARSQRLHGTLALDADGRFLALQVAARWRHGGYLTTRSVFVLVHWMAPMVCGPYRIPAHHFALEGVFTNTTPIAAYRGIARAELAYLLERLVDAAARRSGIDRIELRRRNLISPAEMPYRSATGALYPPAHFERNLDLGLEAIDWSGFAGRRAEALGRGKLRGIGVSVYIENAGGAPSEFARVQVDGAGEVLLQVGTQDFGMGHETVFAQVLADVLGVDPATVRVVDGDTDAVEIGFGGHGSRCARIGGGAVLHGGRAVVERGRPLAADLLEAAVADVEFREGAYVVSGTDRVIGLIEVARAAESRGALLSASATFETSGPSYPNGCQLCEVEVDPETGKLTIERYVMVADPGRVLNPLIVEGQLHGGIAQGVGQALLERVVFDPESGQLLSGSFMDFALPRADDLPRFTTVCNPVAGADNPLGVKGIGEGPTTGSPPAVVNAVLDALGARGISAIDMPLTPERVWRALAARG